MITINNLSLNFGARSLYAGMSCTINQNQRIGLVGRNGAGKSTLLALIAQAIVNPASCPAISIAKNKKVAYLPQEVVLASEKTIVEETFTAFTELHALLEKTALIEKQLDENPDNSFYLEAYAELQTILADYNPAKALSETKEMLMGLGFPQEKFDQPVANLSVGWKMRIVLAKLLLQKADFYLFDEPTNHLDIVAKDWFLQFLKKAPFGFLLVCHERYFLNQLCTNIFELELGNAKMYTGNYSDYEEQKERDAAVLEQAFNQQQKEIKSKQETIDRFRAKASKARMAQSMMKALDKIERITLPPSPKNIHFKFPPLQPSGAVVLEAKSLSFTFDKKSIFKNIDLHIERGSKVALVAANGVGKTTLFNLITGKYPLQQGSISFGYKVKTAIFEQEQAAALDLNRSILENIESSGQNASTQIIRNFLGSFLFSNDDVDKKVKVLSGGEKNKVGMIKVLLQNANFLLLDEPTNHLDIPSKEVLLKALKEYPGTVFFVSHDHDFINQLATQIIELTPHGAFKYEGNYETYLYHKNLIKKEQQEKIAKKDAQTPLINSEPVTKESFERNKKMRSLERRIEQSEEKIAQTQESFTHLIYGTPAYIETEKTLKKHQEQLALCMQEWESLQTNTSIKI